jgi:glycerol-3-phosphate acyltransferase PlsY
MDETSRILPITSAVLSIVFAYLIGSIPFGLIVARVMGGIDIRDHGSGNIGLTNVIRTLGWGPGVVTGLLDFFKGYLPVYFALTTFSAQDFGGVAAIPESIVIMVAAAVILGHLYPVYLVFRGGKGVATAFGVMSALMGVYIFIPVAVFGLILFLFRFVSLASIVAAISVPLTILVVASKLPFISEDSATGLGVLSVFTWIVAALIVWRHKANITRIFAGTEPRISRPKEPIIPSLAEKLARRKQTAAQPGPAEAGGKADEGGASETGQES